MIRVGIQADDLTGACDTGAVFAARGLATLVLLPDAAMPAALPDALVLDTESRAAAPAEARARARAAAVRLAAGPVGLLYKKVDSTLRGAVAAELAGVLDGTGRGHAVLAPAFPAQGRTVVDGVLRVEDRVLTETAVARDPSFPPTGASVLALLGRDGPHPVGLVPLDAVRRGPAAVTARLRRHAGVLGCDAETDADLATLAAAADPGGILSGSAGFAAALAASLGTGARRAVPRLRRPLLAVAGSAHPASREQVARLVARGSATILTAPAEPASLAAEREAVVRRLAAEVRDALERAAPATLLLTGGETAYSVCRALGAAGLELAGELEPGLAVGTLVGGAFAGLTVVTKAGAFGDADTLVRAWESSA